MTKTSGHPNGARTPPFNKLLQRIRDWLREREIRRLQLAIAEAWKAGDKAKTRLFWDSFVDAVAARSPEQVARMERRGGLR